MDIYMKRLILTTLGIILFASLGVSEDKPYPIYGIDGQINKLRLIGTIDDIYVKWSNAVNIYGNQTIAGDKTFTGTLTGTISTAAYALTASSTVYTTNSTELGGHTSDFYAIQTDLATEVSDRGLADLAIGVDTGTLRTDVTTLENWQSTASVKIDLINIDSAGGASITRLENHYGGMENATPSITDVGDGTIIIGTGTVVIYDNADFKNGYYFKNVSSATLTPTDNEVSYVVVNWNSGTPEYQIVTLANRSTINQSDIIPVYRVFQDGNTLEYYIDYGVLSKGLPNKEADRLIRLRGIERESGLGVTEYYTVENSSRNVQVASGYMWFGLDREPCDLFLSSNTPTSTMQVWTLQGTDWVSYSTTCYNNQWYQTATTTSAVGNTKCVTNWIYRKYGGNEVDILLGTQSGDSLTQALTRTEPTSRPPHLDYFYKLVGRIIVVKSANTASSVQSIVDTTLSASFDSDHTNLTNIGTNTHAQIDTALSSLSVSTQSNHEDIAALQASTGTLVKKSGDSMTGTLYNHTLKFTDSTSNNYSKMHLYGSANTNGVSFDGIYHDSTTCIRTAIDIRPPLEFATYDPAFNSFWTEMSIYGLWDSGTTNYHRLNTGWGSGAIGTYALWEETGGTITAKPILLGIADHTLGVNRCAMRISGYDDEFAFGSVTFGRTAQENGETDTDFDPVDMIVLTPPGVVSDGYNDSHGIRYVATSSNSVSGGQRSNWKTYVNALDNAGDSKFVIGHALNPSATDFLSVTQDFTISDEGGIGATTADITGAITGATLNTGQGANELYDMNQNVQTTDSPTFANATLTYGMQTSTLYVTGVAMLSDINTTDNGIWRLIYSTSGVTTSSLTITGLDGDTDIEYMVRYVGVNAGTDATNIYFNGDTVKTNYTRAMTYGAGGFATGNDNIFGYCSSVIGTGTAYIYAKSGSVRLWSNQTGHSSSASAYSDIRDFKGLWNNDADNITTLTFAQDTLATTWHYFAIYSRR